MAAHRKPLIVLLGLAFAAVLALAFDAYQSPVMAILLDGFLLCG